MIEYFIDYFIDYFIEYYEVIAEQYGLELAYFPFLFIGLVAFISFIREIPKERECDE